MSISLLGWLFAIGVLVHNAEEALWLPAWSARAGRWHAPVVSPAVFRFAVAVLTVLVFVAAWLASAGGPGSFGAYVLAGTALATVINVVLPHLAATVVFRRYAPGTATALLLNLPLGGWLVYRSLTEGYVRPALFRVTGPATVLGIFITVLLLFAIGRKLTGSFCRDAAGSLKPEA
jgi:hypothetical protein